MVGLVEGGRYRIPIHGMMNVVVATWNAEAGYWQLQLEMQMGVIRTLVALGKLLFIAVNGFPTGNTADTLWCMGQSTDELVLVDEADYLDPDIWGDIGHVLGEQ